MNGFCGGELLSVTLRHNERGKTLPYMGKHPTLLLPSYLSTQWPCTIWCPYMEIIRHPWAMRSLLKEQTFFERMGEFPEKRREEPRMPSVRSHNGGQLLSWQWTHFRLISQLFYTQRSPEDGNSREQLGKYLENLLFIEATKITPGKIHNSWDLRKSEDKKFQLDHLKQHTLY